MPAQEIVESYIDDLVNTNVYRLLSVLAIKYPELQPIVSDDTTDIGTIHVNEDIEEHFNQTLVGGFDRVEDYLNKKLMSAYNVTLDEVTVGSSTSLMIGIDRDVIIGMMRDFSKGIGLVTPSIIAPVNNVVLTSDQMFVQATDVSRPEGFEIEGLNHVSSDWQVATDSSYSNLIHDVIGDTVNKTNITLTVPADTTVYIRVRYHASGFDSDWSQSVSCMYIAPTIVKPYITLPVNDSVDLSGTSFVMTSEYLTINQTEPHLSTDWQVATDTGFSNIVFQSLADTNNLTSVGSFVTMGLSESTEYYVRCKYNSATYSSDWSSTVHFTTTDLFLVNETQKLLASDGAANDWFGWSCSVSGDGSTVVIGAIFNDAYGENSGSAYAFKWNSGTSQYDQAQKLIPNDAADHDYIGNSCSVSSDGSAIVVGAPGEDSNDIKSGSAYVFKWNSGTSQYDQAQKLTASDGAAYKFFGYTCSISEDGLTIAVGKPGDIVNGYYGNAAYIFKWNSGTSQYDEVQKLTASDASSTDRFGINCSVSSDGSTVVVGAYQDDDNGTDSGSAYVFKWNSGTSQYDEVQKLTASDGAVDDKFGINCSVSGDGSIIVVRGSGSIYVFKWNSGTSQYDETQILSPYNNCSISSDGVTIVAGSSQSVCIFKWNSGTSQYDEAQTSTSNDIATDDNFGSSCSVSNDGSTVVVGALFDDDNGTDSGSAYVFK